MAKNFKRWPEGWPRNLNYPEIPAYELLDQTAKRVPDRIAIIFEGSELTYSELRELSRRFALALKDLGVKKSDRVAVHLPNCPQFAVAYYGLLRCGGIFTPLSPLLSSREVVYQLNDSGAETLISLDILYRDLDDSLRETGVKRVITTRLADCLNPLTVTLKSVSVEDDLLNTEDMITLLRRYEPLKEEISFRVHDDLAHIAYTGGTTGVSKGVMLSHFNIVCNTIQAGNWWTGAQTEMIDGRINLVYPPDVDPLKDRVIQRDSEIGLVAIPWYHAMGVIGALNALIYNGITIVTFLRYDPKQYIEAVKKYKATIVGDAPQLYIPIINLPDFYSYDLTSIKLAASGAAPLPMAVLHRMLEVFPKGVVVEGYGLTECTMGASTNPPIRGETKQGSVGLPNPDTEIKVVHPETGEELPSGAEGELAIKGPQVMKGYWGKPEATAEVFKDGWLLTGDIGKEDEDGHFYITDRKKDLILYKGYNVYPREIEEVIFEHPAVQQCAVVGKPDPNAGEIPVAFVQLKENVPADKDEILRTTNSKIAHYKKIRDLFFVETIPVSGAGKILRRELRAWVKEKDL
jgi:long-chain acyl-CoA synthetase